VARGRLESQLSDLIFPPKTNAANERLARHLWAHRDDLFTFLRQPGLDATNWRAELAIRFGVILRKVWGRQPDLGRCAGAVGPDVGVAGLLAAGAFGPGLPEPTPSWLAGGPGLARVTHHAQTPSWRGGSFSTSLASAQPRGDTRRPARALAPRFAAR
jgi:hypothetical protein